MRRPRKLGRPLPEESWLLLASLLPRSSSPLLPPAPPDFLIGGVLGLSPFRILRRTRLRDAAVAAGLRLDSHWDLPFSCLSCFSSLDTKGLRIGEMLGRGMVRLASSSACIALVSWTWCAGRSFRVAYHCWFAVIGLFSAALSSSSSSASFPSSTAANGSS